MFEKALEEFERRQIEIYFVGVNARVRLKLTRAGMGATVNRRYYVANAERAATLIRRKLGESAVPTDAR
jgi:MFS superfamily sulfate permease-like transporter